MKEAGLFSRDPSSNFLLTKDTFNKTCFKLIVFLLKPPRLVFSTCSLYGEELQIKMVGNSDESFGDATTVVDIMVVPFEK